MKMMRGKTGRGFDIITFDDLYNKHCSIQKSSLASADAIWIGIDDAEPEILAMHTKEGGTGWVPFYIPKEVSLHTRMHLTRKQASKILKVLIKFVVTGNI